MFTYITVVCANIIYLTWSLPIFRSISNYLASIVLHMERIRRLPSHGLDEDERETNGGRCMKHVP